MLAFFYISKTVLLSPLPYFILHQLGSIAITYCNYKLLQIGSPTLLSMFPDLLLYKPTAPVSLLHYVPKFILSYCPLPLISDELLSQVSPTVVPSNLSNPLFPLFPKLSMVGFVSLVFFSACLGVCALDGMGVKMSPNIFSSQSII